MNLEFSLPNLRGALPLRPKCPAYRQAHDFGIAFSATATKRHSFWYAHGQDIPQVSEYFRNIRKALSDVHIVAGFNRT